MHRTGFLIVTTADHASAMSVVKAIAILGTVVPYNRKCMNEKIHGRITGYTFDSCRFKTIFKAFGITLSY